MAGIPIGWGLIATVSPPMRVFFLMGEEPPTITGGYGGWESVERPKRAPLTLWKGPPPATMSLPLLLEGHQRGNSVEGAIAQLQRMGRAPAGPPPVVQVALPGGKPLPPSIKWVVDSIEWGSALRRGDGNRTRQQATLTLIQFIEDERLRQLKAQAKIIYRHYTVKKGDTLRKIAAKFLGSGKHWKVIADLNGIRGGKKLKPGTKLKIPPKGK